MARFSLGGDEDENDEGPSNNGRLSKKPRTSNFINGGISNPNAASPSTSNGGASASTPVNRVYSPLPYEPELLSEYSGTQEEGSEAGSINASDRSYSSHHGESEEEYGEGQRQNQESRNDVQSTEARVDSISNGNGSRLGSGEPILVTLSDPDVLDCPICFDPLCSPVYQCDNGHIACASCCTKIWNKCASCCLPIGYNRCRAMEKVLESVRIRCRNLPLGCKETFSYGQKLIHEKTCVYAPCSCPYLNCQYADTSKSLYSHFFLQHPHSSEHFSFDDIISISLHNSEKHVYLQERRLNTLFVLAHSIESLGSFINVVCIAPTSADERYLYTLTATAEGTSIELRTSVECMPKWSDQTPHKRKFLVPKEFISASGHLGLQLLISEKASA